MKTKPASLPADINALDRLIEEVERTRSNVSAMSPSALNEMPWPLFYRSMRLLTPQSSGAKFESYLISHYGWTKVPSSADRGDALTADGHYVEIKCSLITSTNRSANFVQLRPHQHSDGYRLFVFATNGTIHRFDLDKMQMAKEIALLGSSAHGTKTANTANTNKEYAIRIEYGSKVWDRWLAAYASPDAVPV